VVASDCVDMAALVATPHDQSALLNQVSSTHSQSAAWVGIDRGL